MLEIVLGCIAVILLVVMASKPEDRKFLGKIAVVAVAAFVLLSTVAIAAGHAEELPEDLPKGLRAVVKSVDFNNGLVAVEAEDGNIYKYRASGNVDTGYVRIRLEGGQVKDTQPEIAVKATLVGFDLTVSCFKLLTEDGAVELFELGIGEYAVGDEYYVYYADGFRPACARR